MRSFLLMIITAYKYVSYLIGTTLLMLILGHFLLNFFNPNTESSRVDASSETDAAMQTFLQDTQRATQVHFEPYYHWKGNPARGHFVNVDSVGNRKTLKYPRSDAVKVFCMGGSTMWGRGVPDEATIPSFLQTMLGNDYDVYNLGEQGFVSIQELNLLLERLAFGDIPDIVVFYDGVNDGYAGVYAPGIPRDPQKVRREEEENMAQIRNRNFWGLVRQAFLRHSNYRLFAPIEPDIAVWGKVVGARVEENVEATLNAYEAFVFQVQALAAAYDFKVYFFWQPNIYSLSKPLTGYEQQILDASDKVLVNSQLAVYKQAKERFENGTSVQFIGDLFNEITENIYIDFCHTNPRANRMIAKVIYQAIEIGNHVE